MSVFRHCMIYSKPPNVTASQWVTTWRGTAVLGSSETAFRDQLTALGHDLYLVYKKWDSIHVAFDETTLDIEDWADGDFDVTTQPNANQLAYNINGIASANWIRDNHPEWMLRYSLDAVPGGIVKPGQLVIEPLNTPGRGYYVYLDQSKEDCVQWQCDRLLELIGPGTGWDSSAFLDNGQTKLLAAQGGKISPAIYPNGLPVDSYGGMTGNGELFRQYYRASQIKARDLLHANGGLLYNNMNGEDVDQWIEMLTDPSDGSNIYDGVMLEFFGKWRSGQKKPHEALRDVQKVQIARDLGMKVLCVAHVDTQAAAAGNATALTQLRHAWGMLHLTGDPEGVEFQGDTSYTNKYWVPAVYDSINAGSRQSRWVLAADGSSASAPFTQGNVTVNFTARTASFPATQASTTVPWIKEQSAVWGVAGRALRVSLAAASVSTPRGTITYDDAGTVPDGMDFDPDTADITWDGEGTLPVYNPITIAATQTGGGSISRTFVLWVQPPAVLGRYNAGGEQIAALLADPISTAWSLDTSGDPATPRTTTGNQTTPGTLIARNLLAPWVPDANVADSLYQVGSTGIRYAWTGLATNRTYIAILHNLYTGDADNARQVTVIVNDDDEHPLATFDFYDAAGGMAGTAFSRAYPIAPLVDGAMSIKLIQAGSVAARLASLEIGDYGVVSTPAGTPTLGAIADQESTTGDVISLQLSGTAGASGASLVYGASGLPPGLNTGMTGAVGGTIPDTGLTLVYHPVFSVTEYPGGNIDSQQVHWDIIPGTLLERINVGGPAIAVPGGVGWQADTLADPHPARYAGYSALAGTLTTPALHNDAPRRHPLALGEDYLYMPASPGNPLRYDWTGQTNPQRFALIFSSGSDAVSGRTIQVHWNGSVSANDSFDVRTAAGATNTLFVRWYEVAPVGGAIRLEIKVPGGSAVARMMGIERFAIGEDTPNNPPVFTPIVGSPFTVEEGYSGNLVHMTATDPENEPLRWSGTSDPDSDWIFINGNGTSADIFLFNTAPGTYNVNVRVSDGITDVEQTVQIIVTPTPVENSQPDITPTDVMIDDTAGGELLARDVVQDITAGQVVRLGSGGWYLADSSSIAHAEARGIALGSADEGQPLVVASSGRVYTGHVLEKGMFYAVSYIPGKLIKVTALPTGAYCTIVGLALETNLLLLTVQPMRVKK